MQQTSIAANIASKPNRNKNHDKILQALAKMPNKEGIASKIAAFCSLDSIEINRRLSELEGQQKVYKTGRKDITPNGCRANVYRLVEEPIDKVQIELFN